ncbi:MAG: exodeoxyribonuclease VII large subunit [Candidatus Woesebacteria bacterium]|jgi:exodeoxyribonuclease VII large subunit
MQDTVLSVSDCIALVNQTLDYAYPFVLIEGEVASFKISKEKFVFFDVKDDEGVLSCFMMIYQLRTPLEDGMRVKMMAQPRLTAWGRFSLTVREVKPIGEGNIKRSFEMLKKQLAGEGLFAPERKRILPVMPERVGLIASVESAGYADFIKIIGQRWGGLQIDVADVQVQGSNAPRQIMRALDYFNQSQNPVDVVVLARGGGSVEDLAVFNDEPLVRMVAASRIPTLVAVGHETDTSLCDLVADIRASTPSNAAQLLVSDRNAMANEIDHKLRFARHKMQQQVDAVNNTLSTISTTLLTRMQQHLAMQQRRLDYAQNTLNQLNPKTVLKRGYALVRNEQDAIVKKTTDVKKGDILTVELYRNIIEVGVKNVRKKS